MDKFVRLAIVIGALLAGGGVFYHYVIFLPGVERAKQEQLVAEKQAASDKERVKQRTYERCIAIASSSYDADWASACASVSASTEIKRKNCLADPAIVNNQFMGTAYCTSTFAPTDPSPNCSLPRSRADSLNSYLEGSKKKCLDEARAGL